MDELLQDSDVVSVARAAQRRNEVDAQRHGEPGVRNVVLAGDRRSHRLLVDLMALRP